MWVKGRHQLGKLMMLLQSSKADIDDQRPNVRFWPKADIHYSIHGLGDALTQLSGWDFRGGSSIKHSLLFFKR